MSGHGAPAHGIALVMIYAMCALGVVVAGFGLYCLIIGIKQRFTK